MQFISREELKEKLSTGDALTLVETLPAFMYHAGHLPGALNLPPDAVVSCAASVLPDKEAEIIVYCQNAETAACLTAARQLAALGYSDVRAYVEGKQGWVTAGLPIDSPIKFPRRLL